MTTRSSIAAGTADHIAAIAANYQCSHCNSTTSLGTRKNGTVQLVIHHGDNCPVLTGALSAAPDVVRAAGATQ